MRQSARVPTTLSSARTDSGAISEALWASTPRRCAEHKWVYVPVDGTSIELWEGTEGRKGFGAIGTYQTRATGLESTTR